MPQCIKTVTTTLAITINEGQSISRYMIATDPGLYDQLTFTVNGQSAGTDATQTTGYRYSQSVYQTYTQDTNGAYVAMGTNQVSDTWGGSTSVAAYYQVLNVAPTIYSLTLNGVNGNIMVPEGSSVSAWMSAYDPGADALSFYINGQAAGVGGSTPGTTRYSSTLNLGTFWEHNGGSVVNTIWGVVYDDDTGTSVSRTITVYNLNPILQSLTTDLSVGDGELFDFSVSATDPGFDPLTYAWDLDQDGLYDDFFGAHGSTSFMREGVYRIGVVVSDGDGGYAYGSFNVTVIPEPATCTIWALLSVVGSAIGRRRMRRRAAVPGV
jgi:hypothetical protein